ncbi:Uncharacterized protein pbN1_00290 [Aromatoleum bremense]|nr:Uncharacterized protein pbN1_00290 [Aromatoleum bremense]
MHFASAHGVNADPHATVRSHQPPGRECRLLVPACTVAVLSRTLRKGPWPCLGCASSTRSLCDRGRYLRYP